MTQKREVELYVFGDTGLDNGLGIIDNSHISVEETYNVFVDKLMDVEEVFNAIVDDVGKMTTDVWGTSTLHPSLNY